VVNSGFYGLQQKVSSIRQAAALLGLHSVRTLVLGFSLASRMQGQKAGFDHLNYWRRSMYSATAARSLARQVLPDRTEEAFVAALLMDIGALLLDQILGEEYSALYAQARTHADLPILEMHKIGMSHAEAGGVLAEHWKLPDLLKLPIAAHHAAKQVAEGPMRRMCEVVSVASRVADIFVCEDPAAVIASVRHSTLGLFAIDNESTDMLLCEVGQKTAALAPMFDVSLSSEAKYEKILESASIRLFEISMAEKAGEAPQPTKKPVEAKPSDKRRSRRIAGTGKLKVIPCARGILAPPIDASLKDVSSSGIGLVTKRRLELGTQFIVQLPGPGGAVKTLLYAVVRCDTSCGLSSVGATLTNVLRPERHSSSAEQLARTLHASNAA
jgi:hypothetical protein